ncbi:ABC transporter ATP-binding protein [Oricola cellulosilytica]|uniref:sn-glycerol-3-phosphate ABC transporter ATP-binding protein UgpC n=1 Tax=Oricola cellulosilytica TaxID=1429082 RepID=A0A4R0PH03_9HYPH|nr:sn-glycerol-3-phosphate ABC transporter ATP-binding protein UgpC [Oricola cellulosilytica]TCD16318.1 sn-glycerol-3-phosphate ABC transporter ATP-binding protein UgpC [Oricola cellulosilytica]
MSDVELRKLKKSFGKVDVIHGVDLSIKSGEFAVFVGPSGCGKSTLLRLVAGLEEASGGEILIGDRDVTNVEAAERGIAMVFQSYALYPHMSVGENMGFGLRMTGTDKAVIQERVEKAAQILHLDQLLERKPKQLSGGQRQRVAIGRAIVREPQVFLFDEPLSNLDAELRVRMRLEIAKLHNDLGATMIYVTHDQVEAMTLADKIVVLRSGKIEQVGAPLELYNNPDNSFVGGFIGSPKMNMLKGKVHSADNGTAMVELTELKGPVFPVSGVSTTRAGSVVTVGLRPEHFEPAGAAHIEAKIDVIEHLGGVSYGYCGAGEDDPLTIGLTEADNARPGETYAAHFDPARAFLFDPETGLRIR